MQHFDDGFIGKLFPWLGKLVSRLYRKIVASGVWKKINTRIYKLFI